MRENDQQVAALARVLVSSIDAAGDFIRESLQMPAHSLSVAQLLKYWDGMLTAAVATSTARGEPRVAPTGVALYRGSLLVPTVVEAARTRAIRRRAAISVSRFDEGEIAIIVHGQAAVIGRTEPLFSDLASFHRHIRDGEDVLRWKGTGVYLLVTPETVYTYARYPERFPS
ncbi:MAG: hypothetical protein WD557_01990 [Dehalococcoidia bacterium]